MWHTVAHRGDLEDGRGIQVLVPGRRKPVALFRWAGQYFAVTDECTHAYSSLSDGEVRDFLVTCRSHGAQFDIRTGQGMGPLAYANLRTFPVRIAGDDVQVEV